MSLDYSILLGWYLITQALDFYTTYRVVGNGGTELNPIVAKLIEKLGLVMALGVAKTVGAIAGVYLAIYEQYIPLSGLCVLYTYVVVHNYYEMRKR